MQAAQITLPAAGDDMLESISQTNAVEQGLLNQLMDIAEHVYVMGLDCEIPPSLSCPSLALPDGRSAASTL